MKTLKNIFIAGYSIMAFASFANVNESKSAWHQDVPKCSSCANDTEIKDRCGPICCPTKCNKTNGCMWNNQTRKCQSR
jgi:hypothetical protein